MNPTSQANKMRLHDSDPETLGDRDPFLNMIRNASPEDIQRIRNNAKISVDMKEFFENPEQVNQSMPLMVAVEPT